MRTTLLMLSLTLTSSACYQYFPVRDTEPLPNEGVEVRIQLEAPQTLDLGTITVNEVSTVEGYVRDAQRDSLSLFSSQLRTYYGFRQRTMGAVFHFDRSQFGRLEQRKLVPWKTGVAIAGVTVGLAVAMYYAVDLGGGSEEGQPPNPPDFGWTTRIPLNGLIPLLIP